ncbi:MAG: T9SS type A sorting domain-containing protein [Flavobacteriales bacterium]|nr:T9SS type A sorting domain-containing protein [Flavobacteriales bacterium]
MKISERPRGTVRYTCCSILLGLLLAMTATAQDMYRSTASGLWHNASTWQRFDGTNWVAAITYPTATNSTSIQVRSPHTVTLTNAVGSIVMDDLTVEAGANLTNQSGCHTFNDGAAAVDVTILGVYEGQSGCGSIGCCGAVVVGSSGSILLTGPSGSSAVFAPLTIQAGGTLTSSTVLRVSNFLVNEGTITANGGLDEVLGLTNNGTISVQGAITIFHASFAAQLTNNGTLTVTNGNINLNSANAAFNNNGVLNVNGSTAGQFVNNGAGGQAWNNNAGGVINVNNPALKGIGCCVPFNNAGTFNLNAGQLNQSTVFNHTGSLNIANGATFNHFAAGTNSGTYSIAAGGNLIGSMTNFTGSSITNNGNITVTALNFAGTAAQVLNGTGTITNLSLNNPNGLTLGGGQVVNGTLTLTNGRIALGSGDLLLTNAISGAISGGSASSYIIAEGPGSLQRILPINAADFSFPVGTATSYLPVTISNTSGPSERYSVRVLNSVYGEYGAPGAPTGPVITGEQVERTWVVTEQISGGNQATIGLQWNSSDEGVGFDRSNCAVHRYDGLDWSATPFAAASGTGPYVRSLTGVSSFREFTIADTDSPLPDLCFGGVAPGSVCNDNNACTINDTVDANCNCVGTFADSDNDGVCDANDSCPSVAGQVGSPCNDGNACTINDTVDANCNCVGTFADSDNDGVCDANDSCPNVAGQVGSPCNDGNACTINDVLDANCNCAGTFQDSDSDGVCDANDSCPNVAGQVGSPCNDGNACTINDVLDANCNCAGTFQDTDSDGVCDANDVCPNNPEPGSACDDGNAGTINDVVDSNCVCAGTPVTSCTEQLALNLTLDAFGSQTTWTLLEQGTNAVADQGGPYADGTPGATITEALCVPVGCYRLVVSDAAGDGIANGGYVLRTAGPNGQRILDNTGNGAFGSVSAVIGNGGFCLPLGTDKLIFTSCDKLDWVNNQFIVAAENPAVSAQFGVTNTTSGYQFWWFDPNGTYGYAKFRSHATSDGFGTGATRACHARINNWSPNQIPANVLMNVKVRSRVAGVNSAWGPVCRFMIDPVRAACPLTKLVDSPGNANYSCGVTRSWGGSSLSKVVANPVVGTTQYQFRWYNAELAAPVIRNSTSPVLQLNWSPALPNGTYQVQVRAFKNGVWCITSLPWGDECNVTITGSTAMALNGGSATSTGDAKLAMFPNPNNGEQLTVSLSAVEEGVETISVDIFDLSVARVSSRTMAVNDGMVYQVLSLGEMADGLYMVNITAGTLRFTERLVIAK